MPWLLPLTCLVEPFLSLGLCFLMTSASPRWRYSVSFHVSSHLYHMYALLLKLVHFDIGSKESNGRLGIQGPACRRPIYVAVCLMGLQLCLRFCGEYSLLPFWGLLYLLFPLANIVFSIFFSFYSCLLDCVHVVLTNIKCPVSDHVSWFLVAFYRLIRI